MKMKEEKQHKPKAYLHPDVMLCYVLTDDEKTRKIIEEKQDFELVSSSFGFWEMMIALTPDEIRSGAEKINRLFQTVTSFDFAFMEGKEPLKPDKNRVKHLRDSALNQSQNVTS